MNKISMAFILSLFWCSSAFAQPANTDVENYQTGIDLFSHQSVSPFIGPTESGFINLELKNHTAQDTVVRESTLPLTPKVIVVNQATPLTDIRENNHWFDADLVREVSLVQVETEEPSSLLSQALRFFLAWLVVGMLVTPFVLRLRMYY